MSKLRVNKCSRDYQYNILIICVFQLRNKLQLQRGHTLDVMMNVSGELAYIFTVKGTFIQFLHCLDIFDIDDTEGLFPWKA